MKRALLIGINAYAESPLAGCVNDALDWQHVLTDKFGFPFQQVARLLDSVATKAQIVERLRWLRAGCQPGDELLLVMSGHGTSIDGQEFLVPVDYNWLTVATLLSEEELAQHLAGLPAGVRMTVVLDACHAGGIRELGPRPARVRYLPPPAGFPRRGQRGGPAWLQVDQSMDRLLLAACREDQTAKDSRFGDAARPNGAFTWALLQSLRLGSARTWLQVMEDARALLHGEGFDQEPQLVGPRALGNSYPFLGR